MLNHFCSKKITGFSASFLLAAAVALLAGCGGGGSATTGTGAPSITVTLTDSTGATVTNLPSGAPTIVQATVRDAAGIAVANTVITFSTDAALATIAPASATALTDANGVATVALNPASLTAAGAATITAAGTVGATQVTGSKGYSVGAAAVTISSPAFGIGTASLSAFGTTGVSVTISSNSVPVTMPQTVSFSSPCASSGKAVLTPSVATVNGIATASYRDNGCAGTDVITASVGIAFSSGALNVLAPGAGSIQFVSATPTLITLRGMGGASRQESSQVVFKVVDTAGNPIGGKTVNFSLSTAVGGIALSTTSAISDPATGQVQVGVNSGTVSTPVRVLASTVSDTSALLTTQSDQLTITTGIPDQQNFSLSAVQFNIEGWNYDGTTTDLTVRLADHFGNPVPDGTAVNFTTEGARVSGLVSGALIVPPVGSCVTVASACSARFESQALRPNNGRVTVLAYAAGEEGFTDLNGNGMADKTTEMFDANGASTDMGEAYVDYNENGVRDPATEPFTDFNANGVYDGPDGQYNGVLCDSNAAPGSSAACSAQKHIHVRGSLPIVLSGSDAVITINNGGGISLPACQGTGGTSPVGAGMAGGPATFTVTVVDLHGNAMPAGTKVDFLSDNGTITSDASYTIESTSGCRPAFAGAGGSADCPASAASTTFGDIQVTMKSDAVLTPGNPTAVPPTTGTCTNPNAIGTFRVRVTTPKGNITSATTSITD